MARKTEDVRFVLGVDGADESRVDIKKVEAAFEEMGDAGAQVATPVTRALENIQRAVDRYNQKLADGKAVSAREVTVIAQQFQHLQNVVEKSGQSIGELPREIQTAVNKAEGHVKRITADFGRMNDAVSDNAANAKIAGGTWTGLTSALEGLGGKIGTVVASLGLFAAALSQGWQMGMQFNSFVKTDMSEWDKAVERLGAKANLYITRVFDSLMAASQMVAALISRDGQQIKQAYAEAQRAGEAFQEAQRDILGKWGADWDIAHPKVEKNVEAIKAHTTAVEANVEALKVQADAHVKAFETAQKLAETKLAEKIQEQIAGSLGLAAATDEASRATKEAADVQAQATPVVDGHTAAILRELAAVQEQIGEVRARKTATQELADINMLAGASLDFLQMKERSLQEELSTSLTVWRASSGATAEQRDARAELAAVIEKEKAAQAALVGSTNAVTTAWENGRLVIKNTTEETGKLVGVLENGKVVYTNLTDAQRQAEAAGISFSKSTGTIKQSASEAVETVSQLAAAMSRLESITSSLDSTLGRVNEKLRETKKAASEAAGEEEGEAAA